MDRILPDRSVGVDLLDAFAPTGESQVRLGMVMSVDGSVTDEEGWTSKLGGPADRRMLRALRGTAGVILVGAGSVRTGRYPPHRPTAAIRGWRRRAGLPEVAPLAVITRSGDLDRALPVFTEAEVPTLVVGADGLRSTVAGLRERFGDVLCEGGPGLATALFDAGLVDEVVLSVAPSLLPGDNGRLVTGLTTRRELTLREVYEEGGEVFLRYGISSSSVPGSGKSGDTTPAT
ncbi:hypothetical protein BLA60_06120 [Actinophytocola xinjiangensis]|uniref:Bacterial bifunctional deaminase-reductase C-terminal domain-containing protein n=1 Tax=Actinophytocola xinjiangensis TaxID=485602 RepID=A0A7Z0WQ77_9PSEU|nr:dihydrofolate reductase family protein [Actinophytocola xinjiangensis]OLF12843.1 hypothetical protein BLA60_06120 [Actinophytocola xinjiangensis]